MNTYQVRNISPGGTVWAIPQVAPMQTVAYPSTWGVNTGPVRTIMPVVQGFSPNEARQIFGPTVYPVGGRSAVVVAPPASIIPGYVEGGPVWGRTQVVPAASIAQIQTRQMEAARAAEASRTQAILEYEARRRAQEEEMNYIQTRNQTFASLGIPPRKRAGTEHVKAKEKFIMNAFDNFPGTLEQKVANAIEARTKLDYFSNIGVGVDTKGDLSGRLVKPTDIEWAIWEAYDQGGPMAAEQVRKTILTQAPVQRNNISSSVLRNAKKVTNQARSQAATQAETRGAGGRARGSTYRSRSPSSATRGAGRASSAERRTTLKSLEPLKQTAPIKAKPEFTRRLSPRTVAGFPQDKIKRYYKFEKRLEKEREQGKEKEYEEILRARMG